MSTLVALFHNRWSVPILAELRRQRGSRFVTLARTLGMSRESLRRTLAALIESGLVGRNPGYGHPLRPEYVLTTRGERVAARGEPLVELLRERGLEEVGLKKWSMPVVHALSDQPLRLAEARNPRRASRFRESMRSRPPSRFPSFARSLQAGNHPGTVGDLHADFVVHAF